MKSNKIKVNTLKITDCIGAKMAIITDKILIK